MATAGPYGSGAFGTTPYSPSPLYDAKGLIDSVLRATGHSNPANETSKRLTLTDALNNRYAMLTAGKHWSFLYSQVDFHLQAPRREGTISIVQGSNQVVGLNTTFDSTMIPTCKLFVQGDSCAYNILDVTSATTMVLESNYAGRTVMNAGYQVVKATYAMPSDLDNLQALTVDAIYRKLSLVGTQEMAQMKGRNPQAVGMPQYATLSARRALDGIRNLEVWPAPSEAFQAHIDYGVNIQKLADSSDAVILIPDRYRHALYWGVLADMYTYLRDPTNAQSAENKFRQAQMDMANDKQLTDSRVRFVPGRSYRRGRRYRTFMSYHDFARDAED